MNTTKEELEKMVAKSHEVDEEIRVCQSELSPLQFDNTWEELSAKTFLDGDLDARLELWQKKQSLIVRIEMARAARGWFTREIAKLKGQVEYEKDAEYRRKSLFKLYEEFKAKYPSALLISIGAQRALNSGRDVNQDALYGALGIKQQMRELARTLDIEADCEASLAQYDELQAQIDKETREAMDQKHRLKVYESLKKDYPGQLRNELRQPTDDNELTEAEKTRRRLAELAGGLGMESDLRKFMDEAGG